MATFNELQSILGYDILNPMYSALGGQGNPFAIDYGEGNPMFLGGDQAAALGFDTSFFDPYTFEFQQSGPGNSGTLTAFKDGNQVWQGSQYDTPTSETLRDMALTAGAAFGGLGLAGAGPLSGLGSVGSSLGGSSLVGDGMSLGIPDFGMSGGFGFGGIGEVGGGGILGSLGDYLSKPENLLRVGGNLLSGYMASDAAGDAARMQRNAGRESNALMREMYQQQRADKMPYMQAGYSALGQIQNLLKSPDAITADPSYQFGLNQGTNALNRNAAATGTMYSGQQGKALQRYGQDYAGTKLNEAYNRLASIAGIGQQSTNQAGQDAGNYGANVGNTLQNMGNAGAAGAIGQSNAWGKAFGNIINDQNDLDAMKRWGWGFGG